MRAVGVNQKNKVVAERAESCESFKSQGKLQSGCKHLFITKSDTFHTVYTTFNTLLLCCFYKYVY